MTNPLQEKIIKEFENEMLGIRNELLRSYKDADEWSRDYLEHSIVARKRTEKLVPWLTQTLEEVYKAGKDDRGLPVSLYGYDMPTILQMIKFWREKDVNQLYIEARLEGEKNGLSRSVEAVRDKIPNILHEFNRELNYTEAYSDAGPLERKALKEKYTEEIIKAIESLN